MSPISQPASEPADRGEATSAEELARSWLLKLIERLALAEVRQLPVGWLADEAPALITEILKDSAEPSPGTAGRGNARALVAARTRAKELLRLRRGEPGAVELARDLGQLEALMLGVLAAEASRRGEDPKAGFERLADAFAHLHGSIAESLIAERNASAGRDRLTGLPGPIELDGSLRALVGAAERYGQPFAILSIDIDGLRRVNEAAGLATGDSTIAAVAALLERSIRSSDRIFRAGGDEFCVLAPHGDAEAVLPLGKRLHKVIEACEPAREQRITISIGLASCPAHSSDPTQLLGAATEARYAAKAMASGVALANGAS